MIKLPELMSDEEAKKKGLPYKEHYEYNGHIYYKLYNTHLFSETANHKRIHNRYTLHKVNSKGWREFAEEEERRCLQGYSLGSITITGYHYFFLNWIQTSVKKPIPGTNTVITKDDFPDFWKVHYDWFWVVEIARFGIERNDLDRLGLDVIIRDECLTGGRHLICTKARRAGWSATFASILAKDFAVTDMSVKDFKNDYVFASLDTYVKNTMDMVRNYVNFLNKDSDGIFLHYRDEHNSTTHLKASSKDKSGNITRTGGEVEGRVLNSKGSNSRGASAYTVGIEEFGTFKDGLNAMETVKPLVEEGGYVTGMLVAFGTGGEEGEDIESLKKLFYNPNLQNMMMFDYSHIEDDCEAVGFFVSTYYINRKCMDEFGNPNFECAEKERQVELDRRKDEPASLLKYKAENPITPSESFGMSSSNNPFNAELLVSQKHLIESAIKRKDGEMNLGAYYTLETIYSSDGKATGVKAKKDPLGKVWLLELPDTINYKVPDNLYIGGIDGIDRGADFASTQTKGSDFAMVVKKRLNPTYPTNAGCIVAAYRDRPADEDESFEIALKLAILFNLSINLERTRTTVRNYFKRNQYGDHTFRFCKPPIALSQKDLSTVNKAKNNQSKLYGTSMSATVWDIIDSYLKKYVDEYYSYIYYLPIVKELLLYNTKQRTKYDYIAAIGMVELLDQSLYLEHITPSKSNEEIEVVQLYRYVTDRKGNRIKVKGNKKSNEFNHQKQRKLLYYDGITKKPVFEGDV